jgi:hypothetical protein
VDEDVVRAAVSRDLRRSVAREPFRRTVPVDDDPPGVRHVDAVVEAVKGLLVEIGGPVQFALHTPSLPSGSFAGILVPTGRNDARGSESFFVSASS